MDVNRLARSTSWAHGVMSAVAQSVLPPLGAGVIFMAVLVLAAWWSARRAPGHLAAVIWSGLGAACAYGLALAVAAALNQRRPYDALQHVEVLVSRGHAYGFPDSRTAVCGAVVCGLVMARRWGVLAMAVAATVVVGFAEVYVGVDYPSDAAGGAVLGAATVLVLWPVAVLFLGPLVEMAAQSPLGPLVAIRRPARGPLPLGRRGGPVKLPSSKAMDALRTATEAARANPPVSPSEAGAEDRR